MSLGFLKQLTQCPVLWPNATKSAAGATGLQGSMNGDMAGEALCTWANRYMTSAAYCPELEQLLPTAWQEPKLA